MQDSATNISESATESVELVTKAVREQGDAQTAALESLKSGFDDLVKQATEQLTNDIKTLDKQMQQQIGRVMQAMADNLGGISQQFVRDYAHYLRNGAKLLKSPIEQNQDAHDDEWTRSSVEIVRNTGYRFRT